MYIEITKVKPWLIDKNCPTGTVTFIPKVEHMVYENLRTGKTEERLEWNAKESGIIFNIGKE
jgi:hypothetical protein